MTLKSSGIRNLGLCFQMHVPLTWNTNVNDEKSDHNAFLERLNKLKDEDIEVHITELDVRIPEPATYAEKLRQADIYEDILQICLDAENCKAFVTWGFTDLHSWVPDISRSMDNPWPECQEAGCESALIFDEIYQPKPAYNSIKELLEQ